MNIALVNLDFATPDVLNGVADAVRRNDLVVSTYHELQQSPLRNDGTRLSVNDIIDCSHSKIQSIVAVSPGFETLKFVYDIIRERSKPGGRPVHLGVIFPEFWMVQKLESADRFKFEAFYTYGSSCISFGYERLATTCLSSACADYYEAKILGYRPRVRTVSELLQESGIVRRPPSELK